MPTVKSTDLTTDLATSPDVTQAFFSRIMLARAIIRNYFDRWSEMIQLPRNEGKSVIVRRYLHLAAALSALTEGVPPSGKTPSLDDFTATLAQYGDFIALSDFARFTQKDPIVTEWTELLGEQAGYSIDTVKRNAADAGTTVIYSNGTSRGNVTTPIDQNDLDRAERTLMANGAEMIFGQNAPAGANPNLFPRMPSYAAVIHPFTLFTIQNFPGWRWANQIQGAAQDQIGQYGMLSFFVAADPSNLGTGARVRAATGGSSTLVRNTSGTVDVYETMVFSRRGFHSVRLSGESMRMFMKPVGSAGSLDPLDQVGTMGWKRTTTQMRTNENWILRLEHAAEL